MLIEAGDAVPADGEVIAGVASVDESAITGESAPVIRESGGDFWRRHRRHAGAVGLDRRARRREPGRNLRRPHDRDGRERDASTNEWMVKTDAGQSIRARFFIMGVGCLSRAITPQFAGSADFSGPIHHTGHWPHETVDFSGKRVGMIGTGASAVQSIPLIAEEAAICMFSSARRTTWCRRRTGRCRRRRRRRSRPTIEGFARGPGSGRRRSCFRSTPDSALSVAAAERRARFEEQWRIGGLPFLGAFGDLLTTRGEQARHRILEGQDPRGREGRGTAALLTPKGDMFGCKRLCSGTDYYEAYQPRQRHAGGRERHRDRAVHAKRTARRGPGVPLDAIVCATGFDAMTGSITRDPHHGARRRHDPGEWAEGPGTYLGLAVAGFPNMFNMVGVGGAVGAGDDGDVLGAARRLDRGPACRPMRERGTARIEATPEAEQAWGRVVAAAAEGTIGSGCKSWYVGSNVPGKARVFMPYIGGFPGTWSSATRLPKVATKDSRSGKYSRRHPRAGRDPRRCAA